MTQTLWRPRIVPLVAGLGVVVTFGFILYAGSPSDPSWWAGSSVFVFWASCPYLILAVLSRRWSQSLVAQRLLRWAALVVAVPVPLLLYDAFVSSPGSTNALVFVFLPAYQLFVVVPVSLAAWWAARRERSHA